MSAVFSLRMHKWAIPLAVVIGLGLAIPAGALANQSVNAGTGVRTCAVWDGRSGSEDNGYKVAVSTVFAAFILPLVILVRPVAHCIQVILVDPLQILIYVNIALGTCKK